MTLSASKSSEFRWALIGPGWIAHKFVDALNAEGTGSLVGVLGSSVEKAQSFISEKGLDEAAVAYSDIDALLLDESVDGVYIGTPHNSHYHFAAAALQANKPVLCEKPLTVNARETQALIDLASQRQVFLMEAMWSKQLPIWKRVKELVQSNALGKLDQFSADMGYLFEYDPKARLFNPDLAGGILLDMGIYTVSLATWLLDELPLEISSTAVLGETSVDEKAMINMVFSDSVIGQFSHTSRAIPHNDFWIYGDRGWLRVDGMFWESQSLEMEIDGEITGEQHPFDENGFEYQIRDAIACIGRGDIESGNVPHAATLQIMNILDDIRVQIGLTYPLYDK